MSNIVTYEKPFLPKRPEVVSWETMSPGGTPQRHATATGYIAEHFPGRTHSANHNIYFDIALPFRPTSHAVSLAPRGFELRGVPFFGFRRVGWSLVDTETMATETGVRVNATIWVNHRNAWFLGLTYNCTAFSAAP